MEGIQGWKKKSGIVDADAWKKTNGKKINEKKTNGKMFTVGNVL